ALLLPKRRRGFGGRFCKKRNRSPDCLGGPRRTNPFLFCFEPIPKGMGDIFDIPATVALLRKINSGKVRVTTVDSAKPSPYASALLFSYIANYIYEGDAPLAERRAQALAIDQSQLEQILGNT